MERQYDVLIVGGGPAGYAAALYGVRGGLSVLLLEGTAPGGQLGTTADVDNYPGFEETVAGLELAERMRRGAERFGAVTKLHQVTSLDLTAHPKRAETSAGPFFGRSVIYAAGAAPRKLGAAGEDALLGRGVSYCAACDGAFFRDRTVAVVGGGNSAVGDVLTLSRLCKKVLLLHRRDSLRAEHTLLAALETADNVDFLPNVRVEAVLGTSSVTGLDYTDLPSGERRTLQCDGVFVAVGRIPNTVMLRGMLALDSEGYIKADETTRTNLPGVFAAGDVRAKPLRQIVTAAADGAVAAHFAAEYLSGTK